jgi:hypothetical protein
MVTPVDDVLQEFGKGRSEREMVRELAAEVHRLRNELRAIGEAAYAVSEPARRPYHVTCMPSGPHYRSRLGLEDPTVIVAE